MRSNVRVYLQDSHTANNFATVTPFSTYLWMVDAFGIYSCNGAFGGHMVYTLNFEDLK